MTNYEKQFIDNCLQELDQLEELMSIKPAVLAKAKKLIKRDGPDSTNMSVTGFVSMCLDVARIK